MKLTVSTLKKIIKEEIANLHNEAWAGDPKIKKLDKYGKAEMSKDELEKKRNALRAKEKRTPEETTELRRINFALRSRQKGPKFGKI